MVTRLLVACFLMAVCVMIHAAGLTFALQRLRRWRTRVLRFWSSVRLFVVIAVWIVLLHLVEIAAWAVAYTWSGAIPDLQTALYFSAVTYTTTGYGDVLLPEAWRLHGSVEALTGILMCGWSTAFFFAIMNRLHPSDTSQSSV
jgi:voltage-gated potassium channel Kch